VVFFGLCLPINFLFIYFHKLSHKQTKYALLSYDVRGVGAVEALIRTVRAKTKEAVIN
jgi:hypothetical protein